MRRCSVIYPAPTVSMPCDLNFSLRVRGSIRFPKPWAQGSRCRGALLVPASGAHRRLWPMRIIGRPSSSIASMRGGLPMMRFVQRSCVYRIIGMPSCRRSSFGGGLPMMRLSRRAVHYRIIGMPFMLFALFWHAFADI